MEVMTMSHVDPAAHAERDEQPLVVVQRVVTRRYADAVLHVRIHRRGPSSAAPVLVVRQPGGPFDARDEEPER